MSHLTRTLALAIAAMIPIHAAASTLSYTSADITLHPMDAGVEWVDGLGFRPIDGIDRITVKWGCHIVWPSHLEMGGDIYWHERPCDPTAPVAPVATLVPRRHDVLSGSAISTLVSPHPATARVVHPHRVARPPFIVPIVLPLDPVPHVPVHPVPPAHPVPVVPLGPSGWFLLAIIGAWLFSRRLI